MYRAYRAWSLYCSVLIMISFCNLNSMHKYELHAQEKMITESEAVAISQIGIVEKTGRNDGEEIEKYLTLFSFPEGTPYCAAGVYWCYYEVFRKWNYLEIPVPKTAVASEMYYYAKRKGTKTGYNAKRNDLIVWKMKNSYKGHIERIVEIQNAGWIKTIGFNTSKIIEGKRKEGVFIKRRNIFHPIMRMKVLGIIGFDY